VPGHGVRARFRHGIVPELAYAEVGQAFLKYVRAGYLEGDRARIALADLESLPLERRPLRGLTLPALELSLRTGTSLYDSVYLALAQQFDAVLVTADRRLAKLAGRAELIP